MNYKIIKTSTNDIKIANKISKDLLDCNLSPCVKIFDSNTYFKWNDQIVNENEFIIEIKTTSNHMSKVIKTILSYHNYDNPEIISYNFEILSSNYKQWFHDNIN